MNELSEQSLRGKRVTITGRLASMSRREARRRLEAVGARYVAAPDEETDLLVVGQDGPPLEEDGRVTHALRRARELRAEGRPVEILSEEEWLPRVGLAERLEDIRRLYTTTQLGRILGLPASRVRQWVRLGLVHPAEEVGRLYFFDFRQVASARALGRLTQGGVTPARIRRSLQQLGQWIPGAETSLAQLDAIEQDGELLIRLRGGALADPTGQLRMDFEAEAEADEAGSGEALGDVALKPFHALGHPAGRGLEGDAARFVEGIRAEEEGRLEEAERLYRAALAEGGPDPEVCFNLGNTLYALDREGEAVQRFWQATELDPEYVEAWNNLGNALCDVGRPEEALEVYRRALAIDPDYADAHYNLAETLAEEGALLEAAAHWREYLAREPEGPESDHVREQLARMPR